MSLTLVATPIGHMNDITLRGLETLKGAEFLILEEFKEGTRFLRHHGISQKEMQLLNEHSKPEDLQELVEKCKNLKVALITDCGTPGFSDPGSELVRLCRQKNIPVETCPGPSSLMAAISLFGAKLEQFVFRGFLPAENVARAKALKDLTSEKRPIVLMDTPYRLEKTMKDLLDYFPHRKVLLAMNLTQENQWVLEGKPTELIHQVKGKAEFILIIYE
jgi:16S rRNA (cytidine1402-2'-O)-methyltransferase